MVIALTANRCYALDRVKLRPAARATTRMRTVSKARVWLLTKSAVIYPVR
jgi:hypothetical protein